MESERDSAQKDADRANLKVIALEKEMIGLRVAKRKGGGGAVDDAEAGEVHRLRHEVSEQRQIIESMREAMNSQGRTSGGGGEGLARCVVGVDWEVEVGDVVGVRVDLMTIL